MIEASVPRSPVRLEAALDPAASRWLWLVKWFLLIPHFVVLAFLWLSFFVTTVMAFFAILATGRFPRPLFDFNVGVLRWSWRVSYYGYGALGTDRYPPFSLKDDPGYPAHLDVEPPARLSRGLVLVKWWLLAIPHYVVLGLFLGGAAYAASDDTDVAYPALGLIGLLTLIAGGHLLFLGRYPERLFALLVGLNRWVFRVWAYAALMTDRYPPFALDQGGRENGEPGPPPAPVTSAAATPTPGAPVTSPTPASAPPASAQVPLEAPQDAHRGSDLPGWTAGRVISFAVGCVLLVTGLGLAGAAVTTAWIDHGVRDSDGFVTSSGTTFATSSRAITSGRFLLPDEAPERFLADRILGTVRLRAEPRAPGELFVGVGPADEVDRYLAGVAHDTVRGMDHRRPLYRAHVGSAVPEPPGQQDFWTAQETGVGPLTLTWDPSDGDWTYVLMRADAAPVVVARVKIGAELPILDEASTALGVTALVLLVLGAVLVAIPLRGVAKHPQA